MPSQKGNTFSVTGSVNTECHGHQEAETARVTSKDLTMSTDDHGSTYAESPQACTGSWWAWFPLRLAQGHGVGPRHPPHLKRENVD